MIVGLSVEMLSPALVSVSGGAMSPKALSENQSSAGNSPSLLPSNRLLLGNLIFYFFYFIFFISKIKKVLGIIKFVEKRVKCVILVNADILFGFSDYR